MIAAMDADIVIIISQFIWVSFSLESCLFYMLNSRVIVVLLLVVHNYGHHFFFYFYMTLCSNLLSSMCRQVRSK